MKSKAYGWLAAGVLAAGLNANYHDGGMEWAHQLVDRVEHNSAAVIALASGRADQFLAEARLASNEIRSNQVSDQASQDNSDQIASNQAVAERVEAASCPWSRAMARVRSHLHSKAERTEAYMARLEAVSAREQANADIQQVRQHRMQAQIVARADRLRATAAVFDASTLRASILRTAMVQASMVKTAECPAHCQAWQKLALQQGMLRNQTIRISLPQMPRIEIPRIDMPKVPAMNLDLPSAGPV